MQRTPEPELMKNPEQVKAYAEADFSRSDSQVINGVEQYLKKKRKKLNETNLIIDIACGPGNISERLAMRWPLVKVIGFDGSAEMLLKAKSRQRKSKFKKILKGLEYRLAHIADIANDYKLFDEKADVLVSNSALHHIHDPSQFWMALRKLGKKGSIHFHRDLRRPSSPEEALNLRSKYLADGPSILKKDFLASLHAAFTVEEIEVQISHAGLSQLTVFNVDDLYLEIIGTI